MLIVGCVLGLLMDVIKMEGGTGPKKNVVVKGLQNIKVRYIYTRYLYNF